MNVGVELFRSTEKNLLQNLMQVYRHDMSEFNGEDPDESGLFHLSTYFHEYWTEPERHPYKILHGNQVAGFALVREIGEREYSIAEFFILRKHRGGGIGKKAACRIFDEFEGTWHVAQDEFNEASHQFWRNTIGSYTNTNFEETWSESEPRGPKQIFRTGNSV
jgi:predicted acetyltransferase